MKEAMTFIRESSMWLHHLLFEYGLIYIDLWSIIHFFSGALLFGVFSSLNVRKRWKWLFIFVAAFEVVEVSFFIAILKMFVPEKAPDVFIDIIMGMLGGYFIYFLFERTKFDYKIKTFIITVITAIIVSYYWTGYYGYTLNITKLNTPDLNVFVFIFFVITGVFLLFLYRYFRKKFKTRRKSAWLSYLFFLMAVILFTFMADRWFDVRETSHSYQPLLFNFFKVNKVLLRMYFIYPFVLFGLYEWLNHLMIKVIEYPDRIQK